jgi:alkaline phosphatase
MIKAAFSLLFIAISLIAALGQDYSSSSIFAHNDYVHPIPFYTAYYEEVGFIEADVFLHHGDLMVAHERHEIDKGRTLEELYVKPLQKKIIQHDGFVYANHTKTLTLMIDLKTEGVTTLAALVKKLKLYPKLLSCKSLQITISGNVPDPARWSDYPSFIHFDGRPAVAYTPDQWSRITMISTNFRAYAQWNGKGVLTNFERQKIVSLIDAAHANGKPIRFWAAPDFVNAWITLMSLR